MKKKGIVKSFKSIFSALCLALLFRSLLFEPFHIPSGSMRGTLLEGDYVFVSKYSYGYSKFSFPFSLPVFKGRLFYYEPQRGDVAVFRPPKYSDTNYIKRIIGLPGEKVKMKNGIVYINDQPIKRRKVDDYIEDDKRGMGRVITQYMEIIDKNKYYYTLDQVRDSVTDNTPEFTVPEDHFFVIGDNRDNSRDSRFINEIGYIPKENLIGKAQIVVLSFSSDRAFFPFNLNFSRLFHKII